MIKGQISQPKTDNKMLNTKTKEFGSSQGGIL
jgi:hypothetical protein